MTTKNILRSTGVALLGLTLANAAAAAAPHYYLTDLNGLAVSGINNNGDLIGNTGIGSSRHGFIYSNGVTTNLSDIAGGRVTTVTGINDRGEVSGTVNIGPTQTRGFVYGNGILTELGTLGGLNSEASGINNSGVAVGTAGLPRGVAAATFSNGTITNILPGVDIASVAAINNSGQMTGSANNNFSYYSYFYSDGVVTTIEPIGGKFVTPTDINDLGQVVGHSDIRPYGVMNSHAFLFSDGVTHDLGTLSGGDSFAKGINNSGQVVGFDLDSQGAVYTAFLYSDGTMYDLNQLLLDAYGWHLLDARAINDLGQIIGGGLYNGEFRTFLLTPTAVPVPAAAWLFGSSLLGLSFMKRRALRA